MSSVDHAGTLERESAARGGEHSLAPQTRAEAWRKALLTFHILSSASVLGADLALMVLGIRGALGADARLIYPAAHLIAGWLIVPLAAASLGTGVVLGLLTSYGLFKYWWVAIKLAITTMLTLLATLVLVPRLAHAADLASVQALASLDTAQRVRFAAIPVVAGALLALNVCLATYKPRWRTRSQ